MPTSMSPLPTDGSASHRDLSGIDTQVKVVGALHAVYGGLLVIVAALILFSGAFVGNVIADEGGEPGVANFVRSIMGFLGFVFLVVGGIGVAGGIGLFSLAPWGRTLTLIASAVALINVPVGTALGIYGLVVLTRPEAAQLFAQGGHTA